MWLLLKQKHFLPLYIVILLAFFCIGTSKNHYPIESIHYLLKIKKAPDFSSGALSNNQTAQNKIASN